MHTNPVVSTLSCWLLLMLMITHAVLVLAAAVVIFKGNLKAILRSSKRIKTKNPKCQELWCDSGQTEMHSIIPF